MCLKLNFRFISRNIRAWNNFLDIYFHRAIAGHKTVNAQRNFQQRIGWLRTVVVFCFLFHTIDFGLRIKNETEKGEIIIRLWKILQVILIRLLLLKQKICILLKWDSALIVIKTFHRAIPTADQFASSLGLFLSAP